MKGAPITADFIKSTLSAFVKQKKVMVSKHNTYRSINTTYKRSLFTLEKNVEFLDKVNRLDSWANMVVRHENDLFEVLPGEQTKFRHQRKTLIKIIEQCRIITNPKK